LALPNTYNTTEENLLAGIFQGLGGNVINIGNDQATTKNDLLLAIYNLVNNGGGGGGSSKILSQFGNEFTLSVDEESDENNLPLGTGSIQITKI
jgi:hypothetical protein